MLTANQVQSFRIPTGKATKTLKMKKCKTGRKLVISTNWLVLFGFEPGSNVIETSKGENKGIVISKVNDLFDDRAKVKKVYSRNYKSRRNNPLETLLDISSQKLINESISVECEFVHVTFEQSRVIVIPLVTHQAQALKRFHNKNKYDFFCAMSAGVDISSMTEIGFCNIHTLEMRPIEKRDLKRKSQLTETGALCVLRNSKSIVNLYNEDINIIDLDMIRADSRRYPTPIFLASPQCDDLTPIKAEVLKEKSLLDLSSSIDMTYDLLNFVFAIKPVVSIFENVQGWFTSQIYKMFELRMRRWGYVPHVQVSKACEHGGYTSRKRVYAVFTLLDSPFVFEEAKELKLDIWAVIEQHLPNCRNISANKAIIDGKACGRLRVVNKDSVSVPTILKSQSRLAKDSVAIEHEGQYYLPTEELLKIFMGIDENFSLDCVSQDIGSEIIGQSVCVTHHKSIARSVKNHIDAYFQA
ncbi:MAG: hypothetical protein QM504_06775 [Pseudomonadota bacterium]